jgi:hypothetical protein
VRNSVTRYKGRDGTFKRRWRTFTRNLTVSHGTQLDIEATVMLVGFTWQEFKMQLVEVISSGGAWRWQERNNQCRYGKAAEFDGAMPWIMFHCQFKAVIEQNICTAL